jgi:LmbE family N-acetylglucosaminyl deacetylase
MTKKITLVLLTVFTVYAYVYSASSPSGELPSLPTIESIQKTDRILILAPHPDDEAIGCAGIIQKAMQAQAKVRVVYFTNGDNNQLAFIVYEKRLTFRKGEFIHMGKVRRKEAISAMKSLGLGEADLTFLGYPDFGTFTIFMAHWQDALPYKGMLTRVTSVPYEENFSFGAAYKGESILDDLKMIIKRYRPNKIFVSHPADKNGDHRALYLFLQIALSDLKKELPPPKVYPYLIHCIGWPSPRHYHPELSLSPPKQFTDSQIKWCQAVLTAEELDKKYRAILLYKSQTQSSAFYLLSFARKNELFGDYSDIDLKLSFPGGQVETKDESGLYVGLSDLYRETDLGPLENLDTIVGAKGYVSYGIADNSLIIQITKTKGLGRSFSFAVYLFGYSNKTPFEKMPKIRIISQYKRFKVFNAQKIVKAKGVTLKLGSKDALLKVPLGILQDPDFILSSIKTYAAGLPIDTASFRKINIRR